MYIHLSTARLILRPVNLLDNRFMLQLVNTPGWLRYIGDRKIHSLAHAEAYIQRILDNPRFFYLVIEEKSGGAPVGIVTYLHRQDADAPDIGFALLPLYEGKGYACEACRAYLDALASSGGAPQKIIGITQVKNIRSVKLLQQLGLKFSGTLEKDDETLSVYSMNLGQSNT